ncbi:Uncharacterised protein [Vibrio cincinnatiensis]|uniref:Uncharacterized protein n=1 Tax=Vibrio cincinnatiensis DSM 19608 TaxID=1123491 RepID=A0A1T4RCT2_VIBCI|nr:hypothetical protein [Vibrio cincinnatiensis]SKA13626.1 hypothetical protein SAMN02745782_02543 [Vibrio cincinnatiensis DSM 19608]SUP49994.1 Uncharacterised protein [Vibrio cincinnatiensis]
MNKSLLATAILTSIALSGCGGGSSGSSSTPESQSDVSGVVNKGLVRGGLVNVCLATGANINDESCPEDEILASTVTDESGQYSLSGLPQNRALLFVLTSNDDPDITTQMKCDFKACLDDGKALGEWIDVAADFKLISILSADTSSITAHMTSITDAIAKHTIRASRGSDEVDIDVINNSRSMIAQLFGVEAQKIMALGAVDLTDAEAIKTALDNNDLESVKMAALSAAFSDISPHLEEMFTQVDGLISGETEGAESVRRVLLGGSSDLLSAVKTQLDDESVEFTSVTQRIDAVKEEDATVTVAEATSDIQAAKDLVTQVRTVYDATQEEGNLRQGFIQLGNSLEPLPDLLQEEVSQAFETLTSALMSIAHLIDDELFEEEGEWEVVKEGNTYTIDTDTVKLTVLGSSDVVFDEQGTEESGAINDTAEIDLTITELWVKEGSVELSATEGQAQVLTFVGTESWENPPVDNGHDYSEEWHLAAEKLHFSLTDLTIEANDSHDTPFTLQGSVSFTANKPIIQGKHTSSSQHSEQQNQSEDFDEETFSARDLSFNINANLEYQEQKAGISLRVAIDNPNGLVYFRSMRQAWQWGDSFNYEYQQEEDIAQPGSSLDEVKPETADTFLRGSVLVTLDTEVNPENPQVAKVSLQAHRPAYDLVSLNGSITYNGKELTLKTQVNTEQDKPLAVELSNGAAIAFLREGTNGQVVGNIKVGNKQVASIDEPRNGAVVVRYTNGEFESLF